MPDIVFLKCFRELKTQGNIERKEYKEASLNNELFLRRQRPTAALFTGTKRITH